MTAAPAKRPSVYVVDTQDLVTTNLTSWGSVSIAPLKRLCKCGLLMLRFNDESIDCLGFTLPLHASRRYANAFAEFAPELAFAASQRWCVVIATVLVSDAGLAAWFDRPLNPAWHSIVMTIRRGELVSAVVVFCSRGQGGLETSFVSERVPWPTKVAELEEAFRAAMQPVVAIEFLTPSKIYLNGNAQPVVAPGVSWTPTKHDAPSAMWMPLSKLRDQLRINRAVLSPDVQWRLGRPDTFGASARALHNCSLWVQDAQYRPWRGTERLIEFCLLTHAALTSAYVVLWIFDYVPAFWLLPQKARLLQIERLMTSIRRVRAARVQPAPAAPSDK
jgi:hypothetical protein